MNMCQHIKFTLNIRPKQVKNKLRLRGRDPPGEIRAEFLEFSRLDGAKLSDGDQIGDE